MFVLKTQRARVGVVRLVVVVVTAKAKPNRLVSSLSSRRVIDDERKTRFRKSPSVDGRVPFNESLFAIKLVALIWPRKHLRTRFEPEMVGPRSPSCGLPPNHDTETTVFPRPQRETRERYAPAIAAMIRPTDDDRHLPDRLRAVTRVSRPIAPSVADPPPSSRGRRSKHRRPRREIGRPSTMLIDNFTVKSPNVTYTDEHIESTYTCVHHPDLPRDGSRRASPSHVAPARASVGDFRHVSVGREFVSHRPPSLQV
jgi:hypothetical protein